MKIQALHQVGLYTQELWETFYTDDLYFVINDFCDTQGYKKSLSTKILLPE
jgi:hypothetical protein